MFERTLQSMIIAWGEMKAETQRARMAQKKAEWERDKALIEYEMSKSNVKECK